MKLTVLSADLRFLCRLRLLELALWTRHVRQLLVQNQELVLSTPFEFGISNE